MQTPLQLGPEKKALMNNETCGSVCVFALPGPHAPEELIPRGLHGVQLGVVRPFVANAANLIRSMLHPSERGAANEHLPACTGIGDHCSSRRGVRAGEGCEDVREKVEVEVPAPTHQRPLQQQEVCEGRGMA